MKDQARQSLERLLVWIDSNGPDGFDPYDVYDRHRLLLGLLGDKRKQGLPTLAVRYAFHHANNSLPRALRTVLGVTRLHHATFYGNMMQCHANLLENTVKPNTEEIAFYRNWLLNNRSKGYTGSSWGTPFAWRSGDFTYQRGVPFAVVSAWVGDAFFRVWETQHNPEDLKVCNEICEFFVSDLLRTEGGDDTFCFSYSPEKRDQIHNANLFVAEFLMRVGNAVDRPEWVELASHAARYTVKDQFATGLIPYYSSASEYYTEFNDSYHSSYEIRMLHSMWRMSGAQELRDAAARYLDYFVANYTNADGSISLRKEGAFPIDIAALADTIVLFTQLRTEFDTAKHLDRLVDFTTTRMQSDDGFFWYRMNSESAVNRMPYIRWGQGWMALALSEYLRNE